MEKWYFSFGSGHLMKNYLICIEGEFEEARRKMIEQFDKKWCTQYGEKEAQELIEKYGYKVINV